MSTMFSNLAPTFDTQYPAFNWVPWAFILVGATIFVVAMVVTATKPKLGTALAVTGVVVLAGSFVIGTVTMQVDRDTAVAAHQVEVQEWLADEYSLDVPAATVGFLLDGDTVSVDYDGEPTHVVLTRDGADRIDVYEAAGNHLVPLK